MKAAIRGWWLVAGALVAMAPVATQADGVPSLRAKIEKSHKILGEDIWYGHHRTKFDFQGRVAWVVEPSVAPQEGMPWTWTMQWSEAFVDRTGVPELLKLGFHHATVDLYDTRMNDKGVAIAAAYQAFLVQELGFAPKARLIGMSWGGFFSTRYAAAHPENVCKIYYDAPLLSFEKFGHPDPDRIAGWAQEVPADGWATDPRMPVNMADKLAAAKIAVLLVYGRDDRIVPPKYNCELFIERFKAAGGEIKVMPRNLWGHHPHGLDPDKTRPIVEFFRCRPAFAVTDEDVAAVTELLSIPSITKDVAANDRVTEWMKAYLEKRGVWCTLEKLPKDGRKILYAATQKGLLNPDYIMVTHLDVVDAPLEMFSPKIRDGKIYARGACDTKVNAFCAAKTLVKLNGKGSIACIFASDEEAGGYTSKYMVSRGYGVPGKMVVTLDCANLTPDIRYCCKGNGYYKVTAVGKSGHSSVPDQCVNPIYILAEAALKLRDRFPFQKPGEWGDVASVTVINSGDSYNRIPETAEMIVNVRFVEMDGLERHRKTIADITGLKTELVRGTLPGLGPNDAPDILRLQAVMKRMYPERSANLVRSLAATDARYFTQFKKPIPMFAMTCDGGHSACEWCDLNDIERFTALLVEVMEK